jgi:hypothetical protein
VLVEALVDVVAGDAFAAAELEVVVIDDGVFAIDVEVGAADVEVVAAVLCALPPPHAATTPPVITTPSNTASMRFMRSPTLD